MLRIHRTISFEAVCMSEAAMMNEAVARPGRLESIISPRCLQYFLDELHLISADLKDA